MLGLKLVYVMQEDAGSIIVNFYHLIHNLFIFLFVRACIDKNYQHVTYQKITDRITNCISCKEKKGPYNI
ncbi:MAG: hypothetical protein ACYC2U_02285 [Candidatus Amoebophilus sp.]